MPADRAMAIDAFADTSIKPVMTVMGTPYFDHESDSLP
jgi:hypothetical protein